MEQNNQQQGIQANPNYVINYLVDENAKLAKENAMLKAIIQEQNEQVNNEKQSGEQE